MNTVNSKKLTGGMIGSIGFSQQDLASIKYLFKYLDNGLSEISFESDDDFCLVLDNHKKVKVQVKVNSLTVPFVRGLVSTIDYADENFIVGSSYDDAFRNVLQYKRRHLSNLGSKFYNDKEQLDLDWKEYCRKIKIDPHFLLACEFDIMDGINQMAIARDSIACWAEKKKVIICIDELMKDLKCIIADKRQICGNLSERDIKDIILKHRNTRIERYSTKTNTDGIVELLESIICENKFFEKDLLSIKYDIEKELFVEARSRLEDCISKRILQVELERILLWVLNVLGEYNSIIDYEKTGLVNDVLCYVEFAKAHYCLGEYGVSREWLDKVDKSIWNEYTYMLSAYVYYELKQSKEAEHELVSCLDINDRCVDAYIFSGKILCESDVHRAVECFEKALSIDVNCSEAYLGLAQISENSFDFNSALEYYNEYVRNSNEIISHIIMAKIAVFGVICEKDNWELNFHKWNSLFRKQENLHDECAILIPVIGWEETHIFLLTSGEDGFTVFCGKNTIYECRNGQYEARTSIGTMLPGIDFNMHKFVNQDSINPVRTTDRYSIEETKIPVFVRDYERYDDYRKIMDILLRTGKLHLNHIFDENTRDYVIDDNDIEIEMKVRGTELIGSIVIAGVKMSIWINPVGNNFREFMKQLSKDCSFNEAALLIRDKSNHVSSIMFDKKRIRVIQC